MKFLHPSFLTKVTIVDFEEAWARRQTLSYNTLEIPIIDHEHLVLTKITTNRTKDKLDLEELQKIRKKKDND